MPPPGQLCFSLASRHPHRLRLLSFIIISFRFFLSTPFVFFCFLRFPFFAKSSNRPAAPAWTEEGGKGRWRRKRERTGHAVRLNPGRGLCHGPAPLSSFSFLPFFPSPAPLTPEAVGRAQSGAAAHRRPVITAVVSVWPEKAPEGAYNRPALKIYHLPQVPSRP